MKKLFMLLCSIFIIAGSSYAQIPASAVEHLMDRRMFPCKEVEYNAMLQLPRLHSEHKTDTFNALLSFWQRHCPINEPVFTATIINAMGNGNFNEYWNWSELMHPLMKMSIHDSNLYGRYILWSMKLYRDASRGKYASLLADGWGETQQTLFRDYRSYYYFIHSWADSINNTGRHTPVERYLLRFYARPDSVHIDDLDSSVYNGTLLQELYRSYKKYDEGIHGLSLNVIGGIWIPDGNLAILGNHPFVGIHIGGRSDKVIAEAGIDMRFIDAASSYKVRMNDSVYNSHTFISEYVGADMGRKIFMAGRHELDALAGIGCDIATILRISNPDKNNSDNKNTQVQSVSSVNLNAGLGYKWYVRNAIEKNRHIHSYIGLQAKYNYIYYDNTGGTSLSGNFMTIGLVYGSYTFRYVSYPHFD